MRASPRSPMARRIAAAACSAAALVRAALSSNIFRITLKTPGWNDRAAGRQTHKGIGSASILLTRNTVYAAPARSWQMWFWMLGLLDVHRPFCRTSVSRFRAAASQALDHFRRLKHPRAAVSARLLPLELHAVARLHVHAPCLQRIRLVLLLVHQA